MKRAALLIVMMVCCYMVIASSDQLQYGARQLALARKYDEAVLKKQYQEFISSLDYVAVAKDYPKLVKDLLSADSPCQMTAIRTLAMTGDPRIIPWIVPFLDGEDRSLGIGAGSCIEKIVSTYVLRRRDMSQPGKVVLKPLAKGDLDLKPIAWIALKMFRKNDDGNTHAYAASITRYLEVKEFEDELRGCLKSQHPAVRDRALGALESLGFTVDKKDVQQQDGSDTNKQLASPP